MIEMVPFKAEHLNFIGSSEMVDEKLRPFINAERSIAIEKENKSYAVLEDGRPVVVGGIIDIWENRGEAWLIIGKPSTSGFVVIFKIVQRNLEKSNLKRIEMVVDYDFWQGHRWANLLGFKKEADCLKKYNPDGSDVSLYAMVKE